MALRNPLSLALAAVVCLGAGLPDAKARVAGCSAASSAERLPLIELYTSEGCDSCPPADRWLSEAGAAVQRSGRGVALALHVDYWDHLGWRDRYASPQFSARQRASAQRAGSRVVYTPQVQVNGRDFRRWMDRAAFERALADASGPAQARIALSADRAADGTWTVAVDAAMTAPPPRGAGLYLAVYENGIVSDVRAGENRGARLRHDFVVREWLGPLPFDRDGRLRDARVLPPRADVDYGRAGVVAFVQDAGGEILQTLALPLCPR